MRAQSTLIDFPAGTLSHARARFDVRIDETPGFAPLRDVVALPDYDSLYGLDGRRLDVTRRVNIPEDIGSRHARERDDTASLATEPPQIEVPADLDVVEEPVVFVGAIWPHYGHFITDGMARLWALDRVKGMPLLVQSRPPVTHHGQAYIHEIHRRLGLAERGLITPTRPTLFKKVLAAKSAFQHTFRLYDCHRNPHAHVARSILAEDGAAASGPSKVYLTRSLLKAHERSASEEIELEDRLRREGFEIVAPERVAFADQVRMFNSATWIAGTIGSAFHTCLFAEPRDDRSLFMMSWDKINPRYLMIDEIMAQRSFYLNCMTVKSIDHRKRISDTGIDVERAMAEMDNAGAFARA